MMGYVCRLRDEAPQVRKNTLMVLTHLILNDMVKVKGQISELAICIIDDDVRIASLAKLFFNELSKKVGHLWVEPRLSTGFYFCFQYCVTLLFLI